jgi:hypothetical protein
MTNENLNEYIKHYLEKDKTGRAIMLTGPWGVGKSFYIENSLIPFLKEEQNGAHKCVVVSLYGLSSISEVSKAIYLEARGLNIKSESGQAVVLAAKTVVKGITSSFGIDLGIDDKDLSKIYNSIDLADRLIIFEDVERTKIDILEFMGYVNNLTEQDGIKVLLVTNEEELIKYKQAEDKTANGNNHHNLLRPAAEQYGYTEKTVDYLRVKEKTVGDTIAFSRDLRNAVVDILKAFNNTLSLVSESQQVEKIIDIMQRLQSANLRAIIYAAQKTADIFERIDLEAFSKEFLEAIFYSNVIVSLRLSKKAQLKWQEDEYYSSGLGENGHLPFNFCFDYIMNQQFKEEKIAATAKAFEKYRLFEKKDGEVDPDLQAINGYYIHTEDEVRRAVESVTTRLANPKDIPYYNYGLLAVSLLKIKHNIGIEIETAKELLIKNLEGQGENIDEESLFWTSIDESEEPIYKEFAELKESMLKALAEGARTIPEFEYLPEQVALFKEYVINNKGKFYSAQGFIRFFDSSRLAEMFLKCNPATMMEIREAFHDIYFANNARVMFKGDFLGLKAFLKYLEQLHEKSELDKVQELQYNWFIKNLNKYIDDLA